MSKKLTTQRQVETVLKADPYDFYIHHYISVCTIHDNSGDEIAQFPVLIFRRLLKKNKIVKQSYSSQLWSEGYYKLNT